MPEQWTAEIVGKMHLYAISRSEVAAAIGCTLEYVSAVLNGKRKPKDAEQKFSVALDELIKLKK